MANIAVVGAGYWGKNLIRNFNELGVLHTICDSNFETLRFFQTLYPDKIFQQSFQTVLRNSDIGSVVIATPAENHFKMVWDALSAGKNVFVEKPIALLENDAEKLHQLAVQKGLKLMVGHILLYHEAIIKLKEIIDSGELGKINYIYSNRLNLGKIRTEENILLSFAPHDISAIIYLLGEMPAQVMSYGGNYLNRDVADVTISVLSFKSGVKGHIFVSWLHPDKEQKLVVVGDKRMAVFDDTLEEGKLQIHDKGVDWVNRRPVPRKNKASIVPMENSEPLRAECMHFLECVKTGSTPKTDGKNGTRVLQVLNACQESLRQGGMSITLNERDLSGNYLIHKTAIIDFPCKIGERTKIGLFSHILSDVTIGEECHIGQNVHISSGVKIGNNVMLKDNVSIHKGVIIKDDVFCGSSTVFTTIMNPEGDYYGNRSQLDTVVNKGAQIDANATIVCGKSIGRYSFIRAGSVVINDVPDYAMVSGNPCKVIGWLCECGVELEFKKGFASCNNCNKLYTETTCGIEPYGKYAPPQVVSNE